jgi:hypothetical protein
MGLSGGAGFRVKAGNYGPVPVIIAAEPAIANNGSLGGYFQGSQQQLSTNTYKGTMFFSDGTLWATIANAQGVAGSQWLAGQYRCTRHHQAHADKCRVMPWRTASW